MKLVNTLRTLAAACAFAVAPQAGAAVLQVNTAGILTGATGVNVGGTLYNVTFASGSCISLFDSCSQSAFAFSTQETALLAAQSLLDQVFVDGTAGAFDSDPYKTFGCGLVSQCTTFIPNALSFGSSGTFVLGAATRNFSPSLSDSVFFASLNQSSVFREGVNYGLFTLAAPTDVPEPTSIALFGLAFAGLAFNRRRKA